jgi:CheY-like chemotaxis protein/predicted regulator of Ras-like GTPase activity (Roadblock/LC7/MglB family)
MQEESKTLLIVDDEREFLLSLVDGLQARHPEYRVLTAPNGKEALEILTAEQVDVVLTDLRMPVMDGFELLAKMNRQHWSVPVIVMTAFGSPEIEERVLRSGSLQCLDKPLSFDRVSRAIEQALAGGTRSHVRGIALPAFMQLLEMERKTCTVVAAADKGVARLYFKDGILLDAEAGEKRGVAAAHETFCWQNCQIEILSSCPVTQRAIDTPLNQLLLEALKLDDEQALQAEAATGVVTQDAGDPRLDGIVARLGEVAGVEGVLVLTADGSVSSWAGPRTLSHERFGELMRYATRNMTDMGNELQIAELRELFIEYEEAMILCRPAGDGLVVLLGTDLSKIGAIRHKTKPLITELAAVL